MEDSLKMGERWLEQDLINELEKVFAVCICVFTSGLSLFSWILNSALSKLSQKLISWRAVPDEGSLSNLVTFWISRIHLDTWFWRAFKKDESSTLFKQTKQMNWKGQKVQYVREIRLHFWTSHRSSLSNLLKVFLSFQGSSLPVKRRYPCFKY